MNHHLKILIAVDSSHFSTDVLDAVARQKLDSGAQICILTVVDPSADWELAHQFMQQCELIQGARIKKLQEALPNCHTTGEVLEGHPASVILETANKWHADLIVIGSHGDTGIRRATIGSVAAEVVNKAPCSVEVVKVKSKKEKASVEAHGIHKSASK